VGEDELHDLVTELVRRRRAGHVTLSDVARRIGSSQMTVRRMERGDVIPSIAMAERYASAVGAQLTWELEDLQGAVPSGANVGSIVDVAWGLDEPMRGEVTGVHGSPGRIWLQVELDEGPTVDVPAKAVNPVRRRARSRSGD
jgi:transcriptional regulator with XRE-family HTH domain